GGESPGERGEGKGAMEYPLFVTNLERTARMLFEAMSDHFYKENNILFPTALKVSGENEWIAAREEFDDVGYCCFTPPAPPPPVKSTAGTSVPSGTAVSPSPSGPKGNVEFATGSLSPRELEAMLDTLPVDITFVDRDDVVRYFNQPPHKIFPRTKAVIGRKVQNCHPQKSVHVVERIVEAFKSGERDHADFWIEMNGRMIYIRYLAVRRNGEFLGVLEVTQDVTDIRKLEGQRRLLDWD
ncbi:MAG: DUF438 domain-containing protein, partial [Thermoplasmata archaeon]|nr:DUF438 domain-containing protein [Thermoplasmata archaeon]